MSINVESSGGVQVVGSPQILDEPTPPGDCLPCPVPIDESIMILVTAQHWRLYHLQEYKVKTQSRLGFVYS
jgi:hypothetical protein